MKHDMLRRFAYIEAQLLWGGGLTARALADTFGIARPNAQQTIAQYNEGHPGQMLYDRRRRRQERTQHFKPVYIRPQVSRFLDYQRAVAQIARFFDEPDWADLPFTDADDLVPQFYLNEPVGLVLAALRNENAVGIDYWGKSSVGARCISPHHLVFADDRYHVRAWCHDRQAGRDFVLTRIFHAWPCAEERIGEDADTDWQARCDLVFLINPALPKDAREALRLDHLRPPAERLRLPNVRKALAGYVRRRLFRVDPQFGLPLWVEDGAGA